MSVIQVPSKTWHLLPLFPAKGLGPQEGAEMCGFLQSCLSISVTGLDSVFQPWPKAKIKLTGPAAFTLDSPRGGRALGPPMGGG